MIMILIKLCRCNCCDSLGTHCTTIEFRTRNPAFKDMRMNEHERIDVALVSGLKLQSLTVLYSMLERSDFRLSTDT
jgi:hypothetical protein